MCGITGYFNFNKSFNSTNFASANNVVKYRGPDDYGYITINSAFEVKIWVDEYLDDYKGSLTIGSLGFRRLSIIDLSKSGHQPMCDFNKNYWIVFNGEIYNYIEIRNELKQIGYRFKSNSDTEVILNAYAHWGIECLNRFNGMWAFCIFDIKKRKLFCARDRLGIKPFYYTLINNSFAFCSEIKQLLELFPNTFNKIKSQIAFDFLASGSYGNETNETFIDGIFKLSAGCYLVIDLSQNKIGPISEIGWWNLSDVNEFKLFDETHVFDSIASLLEDSTRIRLRSDVSVGTSLSGGLDSSGIVALVNKICNGDPTRNKVFTINSNDPNNDDTYYANIIIDKLPVTSFMRSFEDHASAKDLENVIWHQEEPLQSASIFGSWQLYKFIKETGITVALDGQGADELMAGYNQYPFRRYSLDILRNYGLNYYLEQARKITKVYNRSQSNFYYNTLFSSIVEMVKSFPSFYYSRKLKSVKPWLNTDFYHEQFGNSYAISKYLTNNVQNFSSLLKRESHELTTQTNLPGILRQVDRNSMAFSVEARLPFLDYRIVELLYSLPVNLMIKEGYTKYAYRRAMKDLIPAEVLWRRTKVGFKMPEYELLKKSKKFVIDSIQSCDGSNYIDMQFVNNSVEFFPESKSKYNNMIWRILNFAIWKNKFKLD